MRILLAGDWRHDIYEEALAAGFRLRGAHVSAFRVSKYLGHDFFSKVQHRLLAGPSLMRLNRELRAVVAKELPDAIFLQRPTVFFGKTLANIQRNFPKIVLCSYNNDNPFNDGERQRLWRHYFDCVCQCHINFFYRPENIEDARRENVPNPQLLLPYYVESLHRPVGVEPKYGADVVFIGHNENDDRVQTLEFLARNGVDLHLFGTRWEELARDSILRSQPLCALRGDEYVHAIASAKISLVFLSHRNRDRYTRRCFEIPAIGSMMLAPRTTELKELFQEGKEAAYFSSKEELLDKVRYYLEHEDERRAIVEAARHRCLRDGHSNVGRAGEIMDQLRSAAAAHA